MNNRSRYVFVDPEFKSKSTEEMKEELLRRAKSKERRRAQTEAFFYHGEQMTAQSAEQEDDIEMKIFSVDNKVVMTPNHSNKHKIGK